MLIKAVGKSVYVAVVTIEDATMLAYVKRVGRVRARGWIRLSWAQWARRPGVRKLDTSK